MRFFKYLLIATVLFMTQAVMAQDPPIQNWHGKYKLIPDPDYPGAVLVQVVPDEDGYGRLLASSVIYIVTDHGAGHWTTENIFGSWNHNLLDAQGHGDPGTIACGDLNELKLSTPTNHIPAYEGVPIDLFRMIPEHLDEDCPWGAGIRFAENLDVSESPDGYTSDPLCPAWNSFSNGLSTGSANNMLTGFLNGADNPLVCHEIEAKDDNYGIVDPSGTLTPDIFDNDTLNGDPFDPSDVILTIDPNDLPAGVTVDSNGNVILDNVAPGEYTIPYKICSAEVPFSCDNAVITFEVLRICTNPSTGTMLADSHVGITTKPSQTVSSKELSWPESIPNGYLVLDAKNLGFVITHMTTAQRDALTPVPGMLIYNIDVDCVQMYRGENTEVYTNRSGWACLEQGCYQGEAVPSILANDDEYEFPENTNSNGNVLINDVGNNLSVVSYTFTKDDGTIGEGVLGDNTFIYDDNGNEARINLKTDGSFTFRGYDPGIYHITYTVKNGDNETDSAVVTFTVQ